MRERGWFAGEVSGKRFDLAWEEGSDVAGVVGGLPSEGGVPKQNNSGKNIRWNHWVSKRCLKPGWGKSTLWAGGPRSEWWHKGKWKKKEWERLILLLGGGH